VALDFPKIKGVEMLQRLNRSSVRGSTAAVGFVFGGSVYESTGAGNVGKFRRQIKRNSRNQTDNLGHLHDFSEKFFERKEFFLYSSIISPSAHLFLGFTSSCTTMSSYSSLSCRILNG
jgi:hypothetical protein